MSEKQREQIMAQWYELVKETQNLTGVFFDDEIASYLVLTLDRYTLDKSLLDRPIATEYLKSVAVATTLTTQKQIS